YVDLLKDEDLDEESRRQYVEILDQKSQRLKTLIDDLFEASKASSGNIELHWEELDIIALLRQTMGEMEEKIKDSTLQIRLKLPEEKVLCRLDGQRTYRVFENILSNILKYSLPQTRVYIDVEEEAGRVSLTFKNISAYEMNFDPEEIVERFTQGDKSRSTEGSGLGLAIAKSLVELQGGRLEINIDGDLFKLTVIFPTLEQAVPTT
ncbi:MAG: sensor histidine kinase, partial [bacterium]